MGREIVYCENCGTKIVESAFNDGKALAVGTKNFCSTKCIEEAKEKYPDEAKAIADTQALAVRRTKSAKRDAQRHQVRAAGVSTKEKEALRGISNIPQGVADTDKKKNQTIYISCGVGAVILIIILVVALSGSSEHVKGNHKSNNVVGGNGPKSDSKDGLLKEGWSYYNSGNYDLAIGSFAKVLQMDSNNAEAYYGSGLSKNGNGNFDKAIQDLEYAIRLKPDYFNACLGLADLYKKNGNLNKAIENYDKVINIDPKNVDARIFRGLAKKQQNKLTDALDDYKKAVEFETDASKKTTIQGYIDEVGMLIERKKKEVGQAERDKAEEIVKKAWEEDFKTNDFNSAIEKFTEAIKLFPTFARAYNFRAWAKREKGDLKGAVEDFDKAIESDHDYKEAYQERGETKIKIGDIEGAIQDFKKVIEFDQTNALEVAGILSKHGYEKLKAEDFKNALMLYNKAIEFGGNLSDLEKADCYKGMGLSKKATNDLKGALDDLKKTVKLDPTQEDYLKDAIKEIESQLKK